MVLWLPCAKGFERHKPTPKRDCKEPLDRRIHHHSSPHKEESPALATLKVPDHLIKLGPVGGRRGRSGAIINNWLWLDWNETPWVPSSGIWVYLWWATTWKWAFLANHAKTLPKAKYIKCYESGQVTWRFHMSVIREVTNMISNPSNISPPKAQNLKFYLQYLKYCLVHLFLSILSICESKSP